MAKRTVSSEWSDYLAQRIRVCAVTGCWIWTGTYRADVRGEKRPIVRVDGKRMYAYRLVWALKHGTAFPANMVAMHTCDRPECVNPDHVRPGTHRDNSDEKAVRGRAPHRLTDAQVSLILSTRRRLGMGASYTAIADATGDETIQRWNVRDVITGGCNTRRVAANTACAMLAAYALSVV